MAGRFQVRQLREPESADATRTVAITDDGHAKVDDDVTLAVTAVGTHEMAATNGQHQLRLFVAGPPEAREVFVDGRVFRFEVNAAGARAKRGGSSDGDGVTAPMPGTVIKVLVEVGQQVRRGETLLKLEAMKMELPMRAPHDATVKAIRCREGEMVQAGARLLDLG